MNSEARRQTVETYNNSANDFVEHFKGIGPRNKDVDLVFNLLGNPKEASVLEIGCGDGRDAKEIVKHGGSYLGVDISKNLIDIARRTAPAGRFEVADVTRYEFPQNLDAVFAFASLLHLSKEENATLFQRVHSALKPGGIFYLSLKYRPHYQQSLQHDRFGTRLFYFYSDKDIQDLAKDYFTTEVNYIAQKGKNEWLEVALRSNS